MVRQRLAVLGMTVLVLGCATSPAQRAFDGGDFKTAAQLADAALAANPNDARAAWLRDQARDRLVDARLAQIRGFRQSQHQEAAWAAMDGLLRESAPWQQAGGPQAGSRAARIAVEVTLEDVAVREMVTTDLAAHRVLTAEARLARWAPLLAHVELQPTLAAARSAISAAGRQACAALAAPETTDQPNWRWVITRYCDHFGVAVPAVPTPALISSVEATGAVGGLSAEQIERVRARLAESVHDSLWYSPQGTRAAHTTMEGRYRATIETHTVTLHAPYRQSMHLYGTDLGGKGPILLSGKIDSTYAWEADEMRGDYGLTLSATIDLGPGVQPLAIRVRRSESLKGYDHDHTYENAGVVPQHDHIPTGDDWLRTQLDALVPRTVWALNRRFVATFCERATYTLDDAALCARGGQRPRIAREALARALGGDADSLDLILTGPAARAPRKPADKLSRSAAPAPATSADVEMIDHAEER